MPDPLAQFRVYPGRGVQHFRERSLHWDVMLYENVRQLRRAALNHSNQPPFDELACVIHHHRKWRKSMGFVLFCQSKCDADTIAHEAVHMASSYLEMWRGKVGWLSADKEEALALATGNCTAQIVKGIWRRRAK